jgi:tRNA (mo5U34)-methyltransferase
MLEREVLFENLERNGLASWRDQLPALLNEKFSKSAHGDLESWQAVLSDLPSIARAPAELNAPAVTIPSVDGVSESELRKSLLRLKPWRKGPFDICGVGIDSEWRSDMKWDRIKDAISPLNDRMILDVGCGNGYYAFRMRGMGARFVIGIDPSLLYVMQFLAISHFMRAEPIHVLPLWLHELPGDAEAFDTAFSMGVLYHQRSPDEHLRQLKSALRPGGELVLETLILPGDEAATQMPESRYARMRNVWLLPTLTMLESWLASAGFEDVRLIDVTDTTSEEQRTTEWMPFESLAEALDPTNPARTIEGWPAPRRASLICNKP